MPKDGLPSKSKEYTAILVGGPLVLFVLCASCPCSHVGLKPLLPYLHPRYVSGRVEPMPFEEDLWRAGKARHRLAMAQHLADQKLLDGKTRSELVEMLGEPDVDQPGDEGMRWRLGFQAKGLFDETVWLGLTMGENGTASHATVFTAW